MFDDPLHAYLRPATLNSVQKHRSGIVRWNVTLRHRANQSLLSVEVEAGDTFEAALRARDERPGYTVVRIAPVHTA